MHSIILIEGKFNVNCTFDKSIIVQAYNDQAHRKNKDAKRSGAALFCPSAAPCYALSFFAITALRAADVFVSYNQITIGH